MSHREDFDPLAGALRSIGRDPIAALLEQLPLPIWIAPQSSWLRTSA